VSRFLARRQRFTRVGSTNDTVRAWLASGTPEVCLAVAREQTSGRGRDGRVWMAPPGAALLLSLGFRPTWLAPGLVWRLAAVASLAMAEASETMVGLPAGSIRLKWPNDLVIEGAPAGSGQVELRKLAGVLGETDGLTTGTPRVVIGIGIDTDWDPTTFPASLSTSMTSLRAISGRRVDDDALLESFLTRLEPAVAALRTGWFDADGWSRRQVTTGRLIRLDRRDGPTTAMAIGVDPVSGALLVADDASSPPRPIVAGEVSRVRLAERPTVEV
jgi:BirA family transcriptional regulator, biotin operon repressor / biotin---[acetyl-CoA-carboxylase] ligase